MRREPLSLLLMHGAGGVGKTRLAARMASSALSCGWVVAEAGEDPARLPAAPGGTPERDGLPLLVVVDYADRWQLTTLEQMLESLSLEYPRRRVRVLLVARPGSLMTSLRVTLNRGVIDCGGPHRHAASPAPVLFGRQGSALSVSAEPLATTPNRSGVKPASSPPAHPAAWLASQFA